MYIYIYSTRTARRGTAVVFSLLPATRDRMSAGVRSSRSVGRKTSMASRRTSRAFSMYLVLSFNLMRFPARTQVMSFFVRRRRTGVSEECGIITRLGSSGLVTTIPTMIAWIWTLYVFLFLWPFFFFTSTSQGVNSFSHCRDWKVTSSNTYRDARTVPSIRSFCLFAACVSWVFEGRFLWST